MSKLPLGEKTPYVDQYDPSLLYPISRVPVRTQIGVMQPLIFKGFDIWNCYEFCWLSSSGKPELRVLEWAVSADSKNIVESKSMKLYLNSFHNSRFKNEDEVEELLFQDLTNAVKGQIFIKIRPLDYYLGQHFVAFRGKCIDHHDTNVEKFELDKTLLQVSDNPSDIVDEVIYSNLLKANCLVTGQPDWGSVQITYKGHKIDERSILNYLISFRNHNEFAEPAAERIFTDITNICKPEKLTIYVRFTRRGGIDINPIRSTEGIELHDIDNSRHVRQ